MTPTPDRAALLADLDAKHYKRDFYSSASRPPVPYCAACDTAWPCFSSRLAAEVRSLEADAKRLDWLEAVRSVRFGYFKLSGEWVNVGPLTSNLRAEIDATMDAAITSEAAHE